MPLRLTGFAAICFLALAPAAMAQERGASKESGTPQVSVERLPVNVSRIGKQLQKSVETEERTGLNLRYTIDVYGSLPGIQVITPQDNVKTGPVPGSGPTHRDMLDIMTPQEFRAPAMDFGAFLRWLQNRDKKK